MRTIKEIAADITRDVMTAYNCKAVVVERIVLMKKQSDGTEKDCGGLCREAMASRIAVCLDDALVEIMKEVTT